MKMTDETAVAMLNALSQATRFGVFRLLMKIGPDGMAAGGIADALGVPQNTLSTHLNILSNAGLVAARREGRSLIYSVRTDDTRDLIGYLVNDCCQGNPDICAITMPDGANCS